MNWRVSESQTQNYPKHHMVAERAVKICHAHSAQTPHKHCEYSVLSEKNGPRIGSVIHEHYLERDNYLHMALEGPKRRKGRRKLCWKAWVVFKICAWLANYFLLSGPSNRRGTCSRPAHRLLHKTKSDHFGCSYASQNTGGLNVAEIYSAKLAFSAQPEGWMSQRYTLWTQLETLSDIINTQKQQILTTHHPQLELTTLASGLTSQLQYQKLHGTLVTSHPPCTSCTRYAHGVLFHLHLEALVRHEQVCILP